MAVKLGRVVIELFENILFCFNPAGGGVRGQVRAGKNFCIYWGFLRPDIFRNTLASYLGFPAHIFSIPFLSVYFFPSIVYFFPFIVYSFSHYFCTTLLS